MTFVLCITSNIVTKAEVDVRVKFHVLIYFLMVDFECLILVPRA